MFFMVHILYLSCEHCNTRWTMLFVKTGDPSPFKARPEKSILSASHSILQTLSF